MAKRTYGSGTIYQRDDGRWIARIEAGWTPSGSRRRISVSGKTEAEARRKLRDAQRKIAESGEKAVTTRITVRAWSVEWLPILQARSRHGHYVTSKGNVNKWIVPAIGAKALGTLTPADARRLEHHIRDAGGSQAVIKTVISTLRTMLKDARAEGHHVPDGIFEMQRPQLPASDRDAIPLSDVAKLLKKVEDADLVRWVLAFSLGIRQAEALGLTWQHVDLDAGTIDVSWQLQSYPTGEVPAKYRSRHLTGSHFLIQPKTGAGDRVLPLTRLAHAALTTWRDASTPNPWGLVFTTHDTRLGRDGGPLPRRSDIDRKAWKDLQKAAKIEPHPSGRDWHIHEIRHTTATMLAAEGVPQSIAEHILGQASLVKTYRHLKAADSRSAVDRIGRLLEAAE